MTDSHFQDHDFFDVLILGSGMSGAAAAQSLCDHPRRKNLKIAVLDGGQRDRHYNSLIPRQSFSEIRREFKDQHRFFLGDSFEGVPKDRQRVGAQLTPPRQFINRWTDVKLPFLSKTFKPMQSLAVGGLGAGWGAACFTWSDQELLKAGLDPVKFNPFYQKVANWMGVSGDLSSDVAPYAFGKLSKIQPRCELDSNGEAILKKYTSSSLPKKKFFLGPACLALLTQPKGNREACRHDDMEFWSDHGRSVFRPQWIIEDLIDRNQIQHISGFHIKSFSENDQGVAVEVEDIESLEKRTLRAKQLIVCLGALNSARVVLESLKKYNLKVPLLSNPYFYIPCLNWSMLGKKGKDRRHSLSQLFAMASTGDDRELDISIQFYSYRSLLLFKLIKEIPMSAFLGKILARAMVESMTIAGVHLKDEPHPENWLQLIQGETGSVLQAEYKESRELRRKRHKNVRSILPRLLRLGLIPMGMDDTSPAGSIHYGGTLPFGEWVDSSGKLKAMNRVWIGDSSPWKFLSGKGLSMTIAAYASQVAENVLNSAGHLTGEE